MVRNQMSSGPGIVEWALPEDDIGDIRASVRLHEGELDPDDAREAWCPVCAMATTMRAAITADGRRFDLCDGCGLLWHVDRRLGRAVAHRVAVPPPAAHEPAETADVRRVTSPQDDGEGTADPARSDLETRHPLAS